MVGITVYPEWAWAICCLGKDVENRSWAVPAAFIGRTIAIHAGAHLGGDLRDRADAPALRLMAYRATLAGWTWEDVALRGPVLRRGGVEVVARPEAVTRSAIVATARIASCVRAAWSGWAEAGYCHWMLGQVRPLPQAIPCRGMPGLWTVPEDLVAEITRQFTEVRCA
jgi:hypothetical protein